MRGSRRLRNVFLLLLLFASPVASFLAGYSIRRPNWAEEARLQAEAARLNYEISRAKRREADEISAAESQSNELRRLTDEMEHQEQASRAAGE